MINIEDFADLLEQKEILKIEEPVWSLFQIYHGADCLKHYNVDEHPEIRGIFRDKFKTKLKLAGVYAYFFDSRCIYIGITKNLTERAYQHLLEAGDVWGHNRYRETFKKNTGLINLFFLPLGDQSRESDYLRSIIEKILEAKYKPEHRSIKL